MQIRRQNALEHRGKVTATMGSVHESMKQIAFGMLVVIVMVVYAMPANARRLAVAYLVQVTHRRQNGGRQHGEHQQHQRGEAQQSDLANEWRAVH